MRRSGSNGPTHALGQRPRYSAPVIFIFGVIPAFGFGLIAVWVAVWLLAMAVSGLTFALLFMPWPAAGIWGALSMGRAALGERTARVWIGLSAGVLAMIPYAVVAWAAGEKVLAILGIAPVIVALVLMLTEEPMPKQDEEPPSRW